MWLTVIGFEFRKHFPCSQKLSDCFSSRSTVIFFLFLSIILKVIFFNFFFFSQLHTVLGQSLPHLETQSLSLFTNSKSMVIAKTCFLKSKFVCHIAYEVSTWMWQRHLKPNRLMWTSPPPLSIPLFVSIIFLPCPPPH